MNPRSILSIVVALAVLAVSGCGSDKSAKEAALEKVIKDTSGEKVDVKVDGESVRLRGEGMKTDMIATSEWPADMFPEVPKFAFGKIERVVKGEEGGMIKFNVYLRDLEDGAVERYAELMKQGGWSANQMGAGPQGGMLLGEKGNLAINVAYDLEKKTGVFVAYSAPVE
jgi:hypothetical protein